jgi:type IV pilus assembly protein PilX
MHRKFTKAPNEENCRGSVLAISMIMILLLTTIGLSGMRSAQLETIMADNLKQEYISFNNAESVALIGEVIWDSNLVGCLADIEECPDSIRHSLTPEMVSNIHAIDWESGDGTSTRFGDYFVEYLGERRFPGESEMILHIFRITSRATDSTNTSQTLVQTIFRRCLKIDGLPCPD